MDPLYAIGSLVVIHPHRDGVPARPNTRQRSHGVVGQYDPDGFNKAPDIIGVIKLPSAHLRWVAWDTTVFVVEYVTHPVHGSLYRCLTPNAQLLWFKEQWFEQSAGGGLQTQYGKDAHHS